MAARRSDRYDDKDVKKVSVVSVSDTIRILDIDLDAFQGDTAHFKRGRRRLSAERYPPWSEEQLHEFLETRCGLSRQNRIPGRFRTEHDGALEFFEGLNDQHGKLLDVVHVDGHADLGLGDPSWTHLIKEWLAKDPADRRIPPTGTKFCNPGSYLAYAAAGRLLASVDYVYPNGGGNDFHTIHFKDNNPRSGYLELKHFTSFDTMDYEELTAQHAVSIEPQIPYRAVPIPNYQTSAAFHFGFACQSPAFTSIKADRLLYVIAEYIEFDRHSDPLPLIKSRRRSSVKG